MNRMRQLTAGSVGLAALVLLGGCPTPYEYVAGGTGDVTRLAGQASVQVVSPVADLAITGGAPVEVNWTVVATTNFASIQIIFDLDQDDPDNGNEVVAEQGLLLSETTAILDTTDLAGRTYYIGVVLYEQNEIAAFGYAPGRLIVNQRTQFYFSRIVCQTPGIVSPSDNFVFDRTQRLTPQFYVEWTLLDPDSTVVVQVLLDPDDT
ncbi:unnamed protein product, partial [marine sediment metagenome]